MVGPVTGPLNFTLGRSQVDKWIENERLQFVGKHLLIGITGANTSARHETMSQRIAQLGAWVMPDVRETT